MRWFRGLGIHADYHREERLSARWCRLYCGTYSDPKFRAIARRTGRPVTEVVPIWLAVLEGAAESGTSQYRFDPDAVAAVLDMETVAAQAIHAEMERMGMLGGGIITNWNRRQFISDNSTERSRRFRERRGGGDATEMQRRCNVAETMPQQVETVAATEKQRCATPPETETESKTEKKESPSLRSGERARETDGSSSPKAPKGKPKKPLPADCPTAEDRRKAVDWLNSQGRSDLAANVDIEAENFRDWHAATGTLRADGSAAWRNWVRRTLKDPPRRQSPHANNKPTNVDRAFNGVRAGLAAIGTRRGGQGSSEAADASRDPRDLQRAGGESGHHSDAPTNGAGNPGGNLAPLPGTGGGLSRPGPQRRPDEPEISVLLLRPREDPGAGVGERVRELSAGDQSTEQILSEPGRAVGELRTGDARDAAAV
jgi:hypothetical protein